MNFRINIAGVKELQTKLNNVSKQVRSEVLGEIKDAAQVWARNSQRDAPIDLGKLRQNITADISPSWGASVISNARYSPYIEWGTVTKVDVPGELADYAIQFKGRGLRKSGGISPRPFFFKQRLVIEKMLIQKIQTVLNGTKL